MTKLRITPAGIVRWMAALVTMALAAALCASCLTLYRAGIAPENLTPEGVRINDMYTWDNVGRELARIAPAAVCWVILLILAAVQPAGPAKPARIDPENALRLLRHRIEDTPDMARRRQYRRWYRIGTGIILGVCLAVIVGYMVDVRHFTSWDLEAVMGDMARTLAVPTLLAVGWLCQCASWLERSYALEWEEAKKAPRKPIPGDKPAPFKERPVGVVRIILAAAAVGLIVSGILNGGMYDVLVKAINICTECIGLG